MLLQFILVLIGLAVLIVSADWLIDGAEQFAAHMRLPRAVVGLTIVAFGTSLPELIVAIRATLAGMGGLALGNIIGSNIANVFLVLGAVGVAAPFQITLRRQNGVMLILAATTLIFTMIMLNDGLSLSVGVAAWVALFAFVLMQMRASPSTADDDEKSRSGAGASRVIMGVAGVAIGAELLVGNGDAITVHYGLRDEFIGLTIIAIGTSLPELATVFASIRRNDPEMAIGNIIGSNVFNLLAVGGAVGVFGGAVLSATGKIIDLPIMLAATVMLATYFIRPRQLTRLASALFLFVFAGYLVLISSTALG